MGEVTKTYQNMWLSFAIILALFEASWSGRPPRGGPPCAKTRRGCGRSDGQFKWVYCNDEWKRVSEESCKAVFQPSYFKICESQATQEFFNQFPGTELYLWNPAGEPKAYQCPHLPTCTDHSCFCNACKPTSGGSCDGSIPPSSTPSTTSETTKRTTESTTATSTTTTSSTTEAPSCKCGERNEVKRSAGRGRNRSRRPRNGFEQCFVDGGVKNKRRRVRNAQATHNKCRIVGGTEAITNEFPWQVGIKTPNGNHPFCGGSILSTRTILTAQHCTNGLSASGMKVVVADHNTQLGDGEKEYSVESKVEHPDFDWGTLAHDFAILYLSEDLVFSKAAAPVCLPSKESDDAYNNVVATVTGWGTTYESGPVASKLQKVDVDTMTNEACNAKYGEGEIEDNMICAAREGKDACQGDSGGPMVTKETGSEDYYSLIGVVSWGAGCADPNFPGVYGRVTNDIKWIKDNMKGETCATP